MYWPFAIALRHRSWARGSDPIRGYRTASRVNTWGCTSRSQNEPMICLPITVKQSARVACSSATARPSRGGP